jgi:hypothetical protein
LSSQARSTIRTALFLVGVACIVALAPASASAATASIKGTVTAAKGGAPVEGVLVCAYLLSGEEFEESCGESGIDGKYAIVGLAGGEYKVEFWTGFNGLNFFTQYYDDREFWETADRIEVAEGAAVSGIDATLDEGGRIEGAVTAAGSGLPLEEVEVCAYGEESLRCTFTDSNGEYVLNPLRADMYLIEFWPYEGNYLPQAFDNRDNWSEADPVPIALGETKTGVNAALKLGGSISGTVTSAASGVPLGEIIVCAIEASSGELYECAETNPGGQYSVPRLRSGLYKVGFSLDFEEEEFNDAYQTQFYNGKTTFAAADTLGLLAPGTLGGINAKLIPNGGLPQPPPPPVTLPATPKKPVVKKCRPGFKKKKVKGKRRCVKVHKSKHRHAKHRNRLRP